VIGRKNGASCAPFKADTPGEILIAYKVDKTPQAEHEALVKAIVTLTGADTTPEAVQQSRQGDFEKRVALWDACVADGKCQKAASNEGK
jgi:CO dehydrogenase/acetyl-CoA synthase alpha subunit